MSVFAGVMRSYSSMVCLGVVSASPGSYAVKSGWLQEMNVYGNE
jgi:hypothetical protein